MGWKDRHDSVSRGGREGKVAGVVKRNEGEVAGCTLR